MGKRKSSSNAIEIDAQSHKKRRFEPRPQAETPHEEITSARQLKLLIAFQQSDVEQARYGIRSFKALLDTILYSEDRQLIEQGTKILEEYLKTQHGHGTDKNGLFLPDLFQSWDFASTTNNDQLAAAVTAVLALLLKVLASAPKWREFGVSLCQRVLQPVQLKLIARSLSERYKGFLSSPALRLMTEVVAFDDGLFAKRLYSERTFTFNPQDISALLHIKSQDATRPSVRSNAVRYVLANFRYQNEGAKMDIMGQKRIGAALFAHLQDDPHSIVRDIIDTIKNHIVLEKEIERPKKTYFLDAHNLAHVLSVARRRDTEKEIATKQDLFPSVPIERLAIDFLHLVSTTSGLGVHVPDFGWYPPGFLDSKVSKQKSKLPEDAFEFDLDDTVWSEKVQRGDAVMNRTLSDFIQSLRPYASEVEQELLLAIFQASPELVAGYFTRKTSFPFDPALTATWIGYASFIFLTIHLSTPKFFSNGDRFEDRPPPPSIVIESILPHPLNQKVLTKCLNHSSQLVSFFTVRVLCLALQKLERVLIQYEEAARAQGQLWTRGIANLTAQFSSRCPSLRDVVNLFRKTANEKTMEKEAVARLITLFYRILPESAVCQPFDVAVALTTILQTLEGIKRQNAEVEPDLHQIRLIYLDHLLLIARYSLNMQWWKKPESLTFSPFVTLLRLAATMDSPSTQVMDLLQTVIDEKGILESSAATPALHVLLASLSMDGKLVHGSIFSFLDLAFSFFVRKSIKYEDDMDVIKEESKTLSKNSGSAVFRPISLILVTFAEQLPFVEKTSLTNKTPDHLDAVTKWLARFLNLLRLAGEDEDLLTVIRYRMCRALTSTECIASLDDAFESQEQLTECIGRFKNKQNQIEEDLVEQQQQPRDFAAYFDERRPPKEDSKHAGLTRWTTRLVEEAIEQGHVAALLECLSSEDQSIRIQAVIGVRKFVAKAEESDYADKASTILMLKGLLETHADRGSGATAPYLLTSFAARALEVQVDPGHDLYPKINEFLLLRPSWHVPSLPSYWEEHIVRNKPETDTSYWKEVQWYVDWLYDGLRTPKDLDILRYRGTFEALMALHGGLFTPKGVRDSIVQILARATCVEGGSTTLITRTGVLAWLPAVAAKAQSGDASLLRALLHRVWETCDRARVDEWSKGQAEAWVDGMLKV